MRIYLASRYSRHSEMRIYWESLEALGHSVTSRWIDCHTDIEGGGKEKSFSIEFLNSQPERCCIVADHDLEDARRADALVLFSDDAGGKGGRLSGRLDAVSRSGGNARAAG